MDYLRFNICLMGSYSLDNSSTITENHVSRAMVLQYNRLSHDAGPSVVLEHSQTNILFRRDILLPM